MLICFVEEVEPQYGADAAVDSSVPENNESQPGHEMDAKLADFFKVLRYILYCMFEFLCSFLFQYIHFILVQCCMVPYVYMALSIVFFKRFCKMCNCLPGYSH